MEFQSSINSVTGAKELSGPAIFNGWVRDVDGNPRRFENSNGTPYRLAKISVDLPNPSTGELETRNPTAIVYQGNYNHQEANFAEGENYLVTISTGTKEGDDSLYFRLSHLTAARNLKANQIGFDAMFEAANSVSSNESEKVTAEEAAELENQF